MRGYGKKNLFLPMNLIKKRGHIHGIQPKEKPEKLKLDTPALNDFCLEDFLDEAVEYYNENRGKIKGPQIDKYHTKGDE